MKRSEAVTELKSTWLVLSADLSEAARNENADNSQFSKRALVRAFFAQVEGLSYQLRQTALASLVGTGHISDAEMQLLREVRYFLDDKGQSRKSTAHLAFPESLLFSMKVYAKNHGATFAPDRTLSGWAAFKRATAVRHRVTHPKSATALQIADADLRDLEEASSWWQVQLLAMFSKCHEADGYWTAKLGEHK